MAFRGLCGGLMTLDSRSARTRRRTWSFVGAVVLAIGLIAVLSGYFASHDQPSVTTVPHAPAAAP